MASVLKAEAAVVLMLLVQVNLAEQENHLQSQDHLLHVLAAEAVVHMDHLELAEVAADLEAVELEHLLHMDQEDKQVKLTLAEELVDQAESLEFLEVDKDQMVALV